MITFAQICDKLSNDIKLHVEPFLTYTRNGRVYRYRIRFVNDTMDWKEPDRNGNSVEYYIHGVYSLTGSNMDTTSTNAINGVITMQLDLVVPIVSDLGDEGAAKSVLNTVRNKMDDVFSANSFGSIRDALAVNYTYGMTYSWLTSGQRQQFTDIGDCFTFSTEMQFYFMQGGKSSRNVLLSIDGYKIGYLTAQMNRSSVLESFILSTTADGASKNVVDGSTFTVSFDLPYLTDDASQLLSEYLLQSGDFETVHLVNIKIPKPKPASATDTTMEQNFLMYLSENSTGSQGVTNIAASITLVEAAQIPSATKYSAAAQAYINGGGS